MNTHRAAAFFLHSLAAMLVGATQAGVAVGGEIAGPGWRMAVGGPLPPASREYVAPKAGEAAPSPAGELPAAWSAPVDVEVVSDEIRELARGLLHDPLRIFNFVRSQIGYEHYYGCKKGAAMTLRERSGNDFDQGALLVALLREAAAHNGAIGGVSYQYGRIAVFQADLAAWLGVADVARAANFTVHHGGFPYAASNPPPDAVEIYTNALILPHVWVEATIGGVVRALDPSTKAHTDQAGLNIASMAGYDRTALLGAAGGTFAPHVLWGGGIVGALDAHLTTLTGNFVAALRATQPNASVEEVTGARTIMPILSSDYANTMVFAPLNTLATWDQIPGVYASTVEFRLGAQVWEHPLAGLGGRRLALVFGSGSPAPAQLWLEDTLVLEEAGPAGAEVELHTTVHHPHRYSPHDQSDASLHLSYKRFGRYALIYSFDTGEAQLEQRQRKLEAYRAAGLADDSREVATEALNITGLQWLRQTELAGRLVDRASNTLRFAHHRLGRVGQEQGFYVDVPLQSAAIFSRTGDSALQVRAARVLIHLWSAMEHGVVEQEQGASYDAVSTVDMVRRALLAGEKVVRGDPANWNASVRPWLENYTPDQLSELDADIAAGARILLPLNGLRTVNSWRGTGYASMLPNEAKMLISGNYFGGYGTSQGAHSPALTVGNLVLKPTYSFNTPATHPIHTGADPVDLASGAFLYDHTDLELGLPEPRGLSFSRHYSTRLRHRNEVKLGHGWLHNWHLRLGKRSATDAGLGMDNPHQAASSLVAIHAALDLYDDTDARRWTFALLACGWGVDALLDNAMSVQIGPRQLQFVRLPGGTFLSPTGVPASLVQVGGGHELRFRHGNTIVFDASGRGTTIRDPYNKTLTIAYNNDGTVNTVTDCYARVLSFTYSGERLSSMSDGTGRPVFFSHTGTDLTGCTDPEGKLWSFEYPEGGHRLGRTLDPEGRIIVENSHDSLDRVTEQRTHGDPAKRWQLHYAGVTTIEFDPLWGYRILEYDPKTRVIAKYDSVGRRTAFAYDGQDHQTDVWTPGDEHTSTTYDADHNPLVITDPLLHTRQLFYDAQQRLDYTINRGGKRTEYTFNAEHRLERVVSPEGVTTDTFHHPVGHPHAGLVYYVRTFGPGGPYTTVYEYDSNGYVHRITHPDFRFESFTNHARGDVLTHTDRRGYTTTFDYNKRRQLTFIRLPVVNGVSYHTENRYDDAGNLWKQIDRFGNPTTHTYSATTKLRTTQFADDETLTYGYDPRDWQVTITDHRGGVTRTDYHNDGSVWRVTDPLNRQRSIHTYDDSGRPWQTGTPRPDGTGGLSVSETRYNGRGEPWQAIDPLLRVTGHLYDENGNPRARTNRRQHTWEFTYNDDDQLEDTVSPLTNTLQKRYDARGLLDTVREPSGQLTDFTPDPVGRVRFQDDALGRIEHTYDPEGRSDTTTENGVTIDRDYDALGRLIRYQHGGDHTLEWIHHDNDPDNRNAFSLQYPDGKRVRYDFDSRSRLWKVRDWNSRTTTYQYDNLGRLEWTHRPNGTRRHVTHDAAGQISRIEELDSGGRLLSLFAYPAYWDNGQVRREFALPGTATGAPAPSQPVMTYDADDRLSAWNGQAITHDDDGNMTNGPLPPLGPGQASPGFGTYDFDARNRLSTLHSPLSTTTYTYTYDAENLRTQVTTDSGPTRWVVNPAGSPPQPLVRSKPDGTITRFVWGLGLLYEEDDTTGQTRTYHYDRRGSTVALSAEDGRTATDRWSYGPYGERLSRSTAAGHLPSDTPFQFNGFFGVQTDPNGLLYMNARYYNVETRRFVSADPLGFAGSANFYWFANADPLSLADPFGLCADRGSEDAFWQGVRAYHNSPSVKIAQIFTGLWQGVAAVSGLNTASRAIAHYDLVKNDWDYNPVRATAELTLTLAPIMGLTRAAAPATRVATNTAFDATKADGLAYRAINPRYAESTAQDGFFRSGASGRLGNDGIYANTTPQGAIAEFQFHNPGVTPAVFEVRYPQGPALRIDPPSGYFSQPLPFTGGANILQAHSSRAPGTQNLLIREGVTPGLRLQ